MKYDVATGLSERLTYGSHNVYLNDISPDGKKLLCSTSKPDVYKRQMLAIVFVWNGYYQYHNLEAGAVGMDPIWEFESRFFLMNCIISA